QSTDIRGRITCHLTTRPGRSSRRPTRRTPVGVSMRIAVESNAARDRDRGERGRRMLHIRPGTAAAGSSPFANESEVRVSERTRSATSPWTFRAQSVNSGISYGNPHTGVFAELRVLYLNTGGGNGA